MSKKKTSFSYANIIKSLPFVAFVRHKSAEGIFSYEFPSAQDVQALGFSSLEEILVDTDGCFETILLSDKDKFANDILISEEDMMPSKESFCLISSYGEMKWFSGSAVPEKMPEGDIVWKGFWLDVTAEKKKDYLQNFALKNMREGVVVFNRQGDIFSTSPSFASVLGAAPQEIEGKTLFSLLPEEASKKLQQNMLLSSLKEKTEMRCFLQTAEEKEICLEMEMFQKEAFFVCIFRDVTDFYEREEDLRYIAYHDVKTNVENFAFLNNAFPKLLEKAKVAQTQIAVLSIRPDSLGQLHAISGQAISFKVVAEIAKRIRNCLSSEDILAQTEDYTFTSLLVNLDFTLEAERKIECILKAFEEPLYVEDLVFDLTVSIGLCFCPQDGVELSSLISHSKFALNKASSNGKGAMSLYNNEDSLKAVINVNMQNSLRQAIKERHITAHFQPQVNIKTGHIVGLEALARWYTPSGTLIPPSEFIPEAEEHGMIDELTEIVLDCACRWNQKWYSMGLCQVPVAVNISARQFHNESHLLCMIDKALEDNGLPPYLLELELTESSAMYDPKNAQRIIQTLLDNNIRCALDDFGTGYSSLSVLRSFPMKKLKIDRSFILELHEKKNLEIVKATIAMAHALNLSVLAEGVETRKAFEILKELNCDVIQGYLFSRPLSPEHTEQMLMRWDASTVTSEKIF